MTLAQLVTPEPSEAQSWLYVAIVINPGLYSYLHSSSQNTDQIQSMMGVTVFSATGVLPAITAIGLSALFLKWITGIYQRR